LFKSMSQTSRTQEIPRRLPQGALGYLGVNISLDELVGWLFEQELTESPKEQEAEFRKISSELEGEFGVAITRATTKGEPSLMLGHPVPGVVLVATMKASGQAEVVSAAMEALLGELSVANGGELLVQRREMIEAGSKLVLFTTMDPTIEVGFTVNQGRLLFGTREGLLDMVNATEGGLETRLKAAGVGMVQDSLKTPSHYTLYLDLLKIYRFMSENYGDALGPMYQAMVASQGDPLLKVFTVFQHAGGNLSVQRLGDRDALYLRLYISVSDLP